MFYECRDPEGRLVLLSERLWRAEICRDHPAVYGEMEAVIATVEEPDIICEDADYPERDCYYRRGVIGRYPNFWLKVVVAPSDADSDDGFVITAFIVDGIKGTERVRWQKSDHDILR
jgi:hypothetical protein